MKIIGIDNFDRETVDDILICHDLTEQRATFIVRALNIVYCKGENSPTYYKAVEDDYKLRSFVP